VRHKTRIFFSRTQTPSHLTHLLLQSRWIPPCLHQLPAAPPAPLLWESESPDHEFTLSRLLTVRPPCLVAPVNEQKPAQFLSPPQSSTIPPTTPRRRPSVTSLTPSPKNKSPKKKFRADFFLSGYAPERLRGRPLIEDILNTIEEEFNEIYDAPPSSVESIFEGLTKMGFTTEVVEDCRAAIPALLQL
jgi:hypothetical protein